MLVFPSEAVAENPFLRELRMDILFSDDVRKIRSNYLYGLLDLYLKRVCDGFIVMSSLDWIHTINESLWAGYKANKFLITQGAYDVPHQTYRDQSKWGEDLEECSDLASKRFAYEVNYLPDVQTALNKNQTLMATFEELLGATGRDIFFRLQTFHSRLVGYIKHEEMKGYSNEFGKDGKYDIPLDELRLD